MTKLESLPNEVFIECFEYLNSFDLLSSFTQLNGRFERLLGSIPLHLSFANMDQSVFDRFRSIIFSNEDIPKKMHSLHLSNKDACWQVQRFLSRLTVNQLTGLQSLTLIDITEKDVELITSILPFLCQLTSFHYTGYDKQINQIMSLLPMTELKVLTIPELPEDDNVIARLSSITNLTVSSCDVEKLTPILGKASRLRYLKVEHWGEDSYEREIVDQSSLTNVAIDLKQLTVGGFYSNDGDFGRILRQTPNLTTLEIAINYSDNPIRAYQWEKLIDSFLPCLNTFKFEFSYYGDTEYWPVDMWFEEFQDEFWVEEHNWYTEYCITDGSAMIYTIPYISDRYVLKSLTRKHSHPSINYVDKYNHVTDLIVYSDAFNEARQERFPHVTSVTLSKLWHLKENPLIKRKDIEALKMIINLSQVTHLEIYHQTVKPSILLEIFTEAPLITSLTIEPDNLERLFCHSELCKHVHGVIKKLEISSKKKIAFDSFHHLKKFCRIFSSLKQLTCFCTNEDFLFYLFQHLPQLLLVDFQLPYQYELSTLDEQSLSSLKDRLQNFGETILINSSQRIKIYFFRNS